jgi:hypothetical protein
MTMMGENAASPGSTAAAAGGRADIKRVPCLPAVRSCDWSQGPAQRQWHSSLLSQYRLGQAV